MQFGLTKKGNAAPLRAARRASNVLDTNDEWLKLKANVLSGRLGIQEIAWITFTPDDPRRMKRKNIARVAREQMKRLLDETGLFSSYSLELYRTSEPVEGSWCLAVTHEEPLVKAA